MRFALLIFLCIFPRKLTAVGRKFYTSNAITQTEDVTCETDEECQNFIEDSVCDKTCKCPANKLLSSDGTKCLNQILNGYGDKCEDNIQCSKFLYSGGVCINNVCKCKTGFHYKDKKCWKNVDLNEKCTRDEQCFSAYEYVGLRCEGGICMCRNNYYKRLDSGCRRVRQVGESCNLDVDCPKGSACNSMTCSAGKSIMQNSNDSPALISDENVREGTYELGKKCSKDADCKEIKNAICLDNFCACTPVKYVASENNKQCVQSCRGKLEDIKKSSCKENVQCAVFGGNSICMNNKCACKNETYWEVEEQFCWVMKPIGDECVVTKDCNPSLTNAECKDGKCACKIGYHQKDTICQLDATKTGDYCTEDDECLFEHSFCNESACACKENYYAQNGKCVGGVKSSCESDADCYHLRNTYCKSTTPSLRQCMCREGYVSSNEGQYCLPEVAKGGKCEESFQCKPDLGDFGECSEGVCNCQNKTHYSHGKCYISKFPKESCGRLQDCYPGNDQNSVICLKGFCTCNHGYAVDRFGICVKINSAAGMRPYFYSLFAALFLLL